MIWKPVIEREDVLGFERFDPQIYPRPNAPVRLRLEMDLEMDQIVLTEGDVTSEKPGAGAQLCGVSSTIELNEDEADWLYKSLGALITRMKAMKNGEEPPQFAVKRNE